MRWFFFVIIIIFITVGATFRISDEQLQDGDNLVRLIVYKSDGTSHDYSLTVMVERNSGSEQCSYFNKLCH